MPDDEDPNETPPEETTPVVDERDQRIATLEAALTEATSQVEALSQAVFTAQVGSLGLLVDPAEMPYDPALVNDPDALQAAVSALLVAKPYLAKMRVSGDIDQGPRDEVTPPVSLTGILKQFA